MIDEALDAIGETKPIESLRNADHIWIGHFLAEIVLVDASHQPVTIIKIILLCEKENILVYS